MDTINTTAAPIEGQVWTTRAPLTPEEEDAIVTLVVVVVGIIVAIIVLFSMGLFIDCRQQKQDTLKNKKRLRLKMPGGPRRKNHGEDGKSLASDMCPSGTTDFGAIRLTNDVTV